MKRPAEVEKLLADIAKVDPKFAVQLRKLSLGQIYEALKKKEADLILRTVGLSTKKEELDKEIANLQFQIDLYEGRITIDPDSAHRTEGL